MSTHSNILQALTDADSWSAANESAILEPYSYISDNPGKDVRTRMIEAFNLWLNVPQAQLQTIAKVVNMLHTASLLVDDIEDDSQLRRGNPVAHKIYGIPQTINTANYVYFQAFKELFALRQGSNADLDGIVTEELLCLHRGQGLEILWRDSLQCPTEEEYVRMVNFSTFRPFSMYTAYTRSETGGLLRIGIKLMMACSTTNTDVDYVPVVNLIGVYYQIRDDYMNLQSSEYSVNKGFAEDLTEGKFSFPVVHGIRADRSNRQILNVLQKRPSTPTLKRHTIEYLRTKTKSFDYTLSVIRELEQKTLEEIARLGGNAGLAKLMELLHIQPDDQ
ncbi:hypothetical protein CCMSSC00406_0009932 [Pleurotus cornucopiae]|uniref:Uncharacterized protein n=1 Tax=Pleurotus cornucopiae TaxID=5321 RepID=A0ACB7IUF2_PLECO|nr:hypothetical protein CCMSSC00406_0009932 [Pleurotus cornucopiae]